MLFIVDLDSGKLVPSDFETSGSKFALNPRSAGAEKEVTQLSNTEGGEPGGSHHYSAGRVERSKHVGNALLNIETDLCGFLLWESIETLFLYMKLSLPHALYFASTALSSPRLVGVSLRMP